MNEKIITPLGVGNLVGYIRRGGEVTDILVLQWRKARDRRPEGPMVVTAYPAHEWMEVYGGPCKILRRIG